MASCLYFRRDRQTRTANSLEYPSFISVDEDQEQRQIHFQAEPFADRTTRLLLPRAGAGDILLCVGRIRRGIATTEKRPAESARTRRNAAA
jgi:hypothetical protein